MHAHNLAVLSDKKAAESAPVGTKVVTCALQTAVETTHSHQHTEVRFACVLSTGQENRHTNRAQSIQSHGHVLCANAAGHSASIPKIEATSKTL